MTDIIKKILSKREKDLNANTSSYLLKNSINYQPINYDNLFYQFENNLSEENKNCEEINNDYNYEEFKKDFNKKLNKEIEIDQANEEENSQNEIQDDEIPLATLNYISICQCCKNKFDKEKCLPYLLKCGHFFCLDCIKQYFIDETGVVCPSDGLVAQSIDELKFLKNLVSNPKKTLNKLMKKKNTAEKMNCLLLENESNCNIENNDNNDNNYNIEKLSKSNNIYSYKSNYCPIHETQRLSHIVNDTNEVICVHCAFERLKAHPNIQIKEIKEKYVEYNDIIENIIINIQKNIDLINNTMEMINKNKENEIKKLNHFYNNILKYIEAQKKEKIQQIENISNENLHDLDQKLLIFNEIIEQGEEIQKKLEKDESNSNQEFSIIFNEYNNFIKLSETNFDNKLNNKLKYMRFTNQNEINIKEFLSKISDLNISFRVIKYTKGNIKGMKIKNNNNNLNKIVKTDNEMRDRNHSSFQYYKIMANKKMNFRNNLKNISNSNENQMKNYSNDKYKYKTNNPINSVELNSFFQNKNNDNNHIMKINHFRNKQDISSKPGSVTKRPSYIKKQVEENFYDNNNKTLRSKKNNSLLETYFELKKNEKHNTNNNYDSYSKWNKKNESQKNNKSFNNLNILNNFYNLNLSKNGNNINNELKAKIGTSYFSYKKNYEKVNMKFYNESLGKLMPEQMKKLNKTYNFNY